MQSFFVIVLDVPKNVLEAAFEASIIVNDEFLLSDLNCETATQSPAVQAISEVEEPCGFSHPYLDPHNPIAVGIRLHSLGQRQVARTVVAVKNSYLVFRTLQEAHEARQEAMPQEVEHKVFMVLVVLERYFAGLAKLVVTRHLGYPLLYACPQPPQFYAGSAADTTRVGNFGEVFAREGKTVSVQNSSCFVGEERVERGGHLSDGDLSEFERGTLYTTIFHETNCA